jgi:hypothetical protein
MLGLSRATFSIAFLFFAGSAAALAACSAASNTSGFAEGGGGSGGSPTTTQTGTGGAPLTTTSGDGGSDFDAGTGGGTSSGGDDDCADATKLVYVVGQSGTLYSFDPPSLALTPVGQLACPGPGTPFSMAVDRSGTAWVLFDTGNIYQVSTKDASCKATSYVSGQAGLTKFGMGFVSNAPGSKDESLYLADYTGGGLAKLDTATMKVSMVGPYDQISSAAELTGTGDARLYGFFQGNPIVIAQIDKSNAHIIDEAPQPLVDIGSGWAFAFWGGDFWLFTAPLGTSQIQRYSPNDDTTETVKTGIADVIVGAGVSTCAPVAPPK